MMLSLQNPIKGIRLENVIVESSLIKEYKGHSLRGLESKGYSKLSVGFFVFEKFGWRSQVCSWARASEAKRGVRFRDRLERDWHSDANWRHRYGWDCQEKV